MISGLLKYFGRGDRNQLRHFVQIYFLIMLGHCFYNQSFYFLKNYRPENIFLPLFVNTPVENVLIYYQAAQLLFALLTLIGYYPNISKYFFFFALCLAWNHDFLATFDSLRHLELLIAFLILFVRLPASRLFHSAVKFHRNRQILFWSLLRVSLALYVFWMIFWQITDFQYLPRGINIISLLANTCLLTSLLMRRTMNVGFTVFWLALVVHTGISVAQDELLPAVFQLILFPAVFQYRKTVFWLKKLAPKS